MTKESMIKVLRHKAEHIKARIKPEFFLEVADVLEQQSEDAISRQAALDIYDDYNVAVENGDLEAYRKYRKRLLKLPPVQPKIGHWIKITPSGIYMCSECEQNVLTGDIDAYHYCHHCGIKMIEPEESEETND